MTEARLKEIKENFIDSYPRTWPEGQRQATVDLYDAHVAILRIVKSIAEQECFECGCPAVARRAMTF